MPVVWPLFRLPPVHPLPFLIREENRRKLGDAKEATIPIELSEVRKLNFEELPNLRGFSCGDIVEWPFLKDVIV
ncbi:hypothetical protein VIGAN_05228500, partial [Vigna angularis var. angularis]